MSIRIAEFESEKEWDYENGFYLTSQPSRLNKIIAHYELYKSVASLPGNIVECGVFKGASFIRWCTFRNSLESETSRKVIGFDAFGKFPQPGGSDDIEFVTKFEQNAGNGLSKDELNKALQYKGLGNYELVPGDILTTVPQYVTDNPALKIALLHIDVDTYEPSKVALDVLFDAVVPGGLVVFDDYAVAAGETKAVDEFLAGKHWQLEKLPMSHIPCFIRK